ncbi:helix-turn-helix domain-containing protein [Streptomyces spiralis]
MEVAVAEVPADDQVGADLALAHGVRVQVVTEVGLGHRQLPVALAVYRAPGDEPAARTESAARLRETLLTLVQERGSLAAAADRLHVPKNTVKYRVARTVAQLGRPLEGDRLEFEPARTAVGWLGVAVLPERSPPSRAVSRAPALCGVREVAREGDIAKPLAAGPAP